MANYTAADVKKLRDMTGSGMMDCKKALAENDGDFDKAVETLRIQGAKDVGKRADRDASEGLIAVSGNTMVEVNCETDFVAKNQDFINFAQKIADAAASAKANSQEELVAVEVDGSTAGDLIQEQSAKIGEKLELKRAATVDSDKVATYLHKRSGDLPPSVGVMVSYESDADNADNVARAAAMQVAALKAKYLTREDVPSEIVEKEKAIAEQITREEGKPEKAIPKIVEGRLNGFYKDVVLLEQPSLEDNKKTVAQVTEEAGVKLTGFRRFEVGQA